MSNKYAAEISEALGLKEVTKLTLRFEVDKPAVAEVEMFVFDEAALEKVTTVVRQYSLTETKLKSMGKAVYLGDSIYADTDEFGQIELWLDNGLGPKHRIVLEQPTLEAFINLAKARWGDVWWQSFLASQGA